MRNINVVIIVLARETKLATLYQLLIDHAKTRNCYQLLLAWLSVFSGYRSTSTSANLLIPIQIEYAYKPTILSCFKFLDNLEYSKFKSRLIGILFPNYISYVQITPGNFAGSCFYFFTIDLEKSPACGDTSQKGQLTCFISSKGILPCRTSPDILI